MKFRREPGDILKLLGIYQAEDIDLDLVAHFLNAEVKRTSLSDCEGHIVGTDSRAIITVNGNARPERQRFSLGHELGHWVNDKKQNLTYRCSTDDMRQREPRSNDFRQHKEVRANQFSAELIIPKHIAEPLIDGAEVTFESIGSLANSFNASKTSSAIRFVELSQLPCMLVCWSRNGNRRWFSRSSVVPDSIWPHQRIDKPREYFQSSSAKEVDADVWIDHTDSSDFTIIQSIFSNSYDILSLLWWKDESQLLSID